MIVKVLFTKKMNILLNELFDGDFDEFKKHIPMGEKRLKQYLDEKFCVDKNYPSSQFLNIVKNDKKNKFFKDLGLKAIDFKNSTKLNEFRKKVSGAKEVYFNTSDIVGRYNLFYDNELKGIIEIQKFANSKYIATYFFDNKKLKSFYFEVFYYQVFIKFNNFNNDILSFDLYKPTNNKDILIGTLQGLDKVTHLPYTKKVSFIKKDSYIKIWDHLKYQNENMIFHEKDLKPINSLKERTDYCLTSFEKSVDYFRQRILFFKNYFESKGYNFYYLYVLDDIEETLEKQKDDYMRDKSYALRGNIETGKMFFKYVYIYATTKNPNIECFLITTPVSNFDKSIYSDTHSGKKEYQQLSLNLAKKIKKINRIFMINNIKIFNHVKDILVEQHRHNINIYICNDLSQTSYTEVAYTSIKKHVLFIRKNDSRSISQVAKGKSLIDDIDIEFKKIINNLTNTKKLDYFLDDDFNFNMNKVKKFFKNKKS